MWSCQLRLDSLVLSTVHSSGLVVNNDLSLLFWSCQLRRDSVILGSQLQLDLLTSGLVIFDLLLLFKVLSSLTLVSYLVSFFLSRYIIYLWARWSAHQRFIWDGQQFTILFSNNIGRSTLINNNYSFLSSKYPNVRSLGRV